MVSFKMKASLLSGLAHRLNLLDGQLVHDTLSEVDPLLSVRKCQKVVRVLNEANSEFMEAVTEIENEKTAAFNEVKEKFDRDTEGMDVAAKQEAGKKVQVQVNAKLAEIQKKSRAKPDSEIEVTVDDELFSRVLVPLFHKTVSTWDTDGSGEGQRKFVEVAECLGL